VNDEGEEETHETRVRVRLAIVKIELEKVSLPVLRGEVDHCDQKKVKDRGEAVPGDEFAKGDRETIDVFLGNVADQDK
jgi:hypothetical protein